MGEYQIGDLSKLFQSSDKVKKDANDIFKKKASSAPPQNGKPTKRKGNENKNKMLKKKKKSFGASHRLEMRQKKKTKDKEKDELKDKQNIQSGCNSTWKTSVKTKPVAKVKRLGKTEKKTLNKSWLDRENLDSDVSSSDGDEDYDTSFGRDYNKDISAALSLDSDENDEGDIENDEDGMSVDNDEENVTKLAEGDDDVGDEDLDDDDDNITATNPLGPGFCPPPGIVHESLMKKPKKRKLPPVDGVEKNELPSPKKKSKQTDDDSDNDGKTKKATRLRKDRLLKATNDQTIFIGNLSLKTPAKKLRRLFRKFGEIESVRYRCLPVNDLKLPKKVIAIRKEFHPERSNCVCYIRFKEKESTEQALSLNGLEVDGLHIRVDMAGKTKLNDVKKSVFIGSLPFDIEEEAVREHFEDCGAVQNVRLIRDRVTCLGKGFGYIRFEDKDAVSFALKLNGSKLKGRKIRVMKCNKDGTGIAGDVEKNKTSVKDKQKKGDHGQKAKQKQKNPDHQFSGEKAKKVKKKSKRDNSGGKVKVHFKTKGTSDSLKGSVKSLIESEMKKTATTDSDLSEKKTKKIKEHTANQSSMSEKLVTEEESFPRTVKKHNMKGTSHSDADIAAEKKDGDKSYNGGGKSFESKEKSYENKGKPFEKNGKPFEKVGKRFEKNGKPFEKAGKPFEKNGKPFEKKKGGPFENEGGKSFEKKGESTFQRKGKQPQDFKGKNTTFKNKFDNGDHFFGKEGKQKASFGNKPFIKGDRSFQKGSQKERFGNKPFDKSNRSFDKGSSNRGEFGNKSFGGEKGLASGNKSFGKGFSQQSGFGRSFSTGQSNSLQVGTGKHIVFDD